MDGQEKRQHKANQQNNHILERHLLDAFHYIDNRSDDQSNEEGPNKDLMRLDHTLQENGGKHHAYDNAQQNGDEESKIRPAGKFGDLSLEEILEVFVIQRLD